MSAVMADPATWTVSDRPAFTWWIMVEREVAVDDPNEGPSLLVGPYTTERFATNAIHDAPLIEGLCQDHATDCYLVGPDDHVDPEGVSIVDIASEADPSYYGYQDTACASCWNNYTMAEFLSSGFTHECPADDEDEDERETVRLVIEVEYDPTEAEHPATWNWTELVGDPTLVIRED